MLLWELRAARLAQELNLWRTEEASRLIDLEMLLNIPVHTHTHTYTHLSYTRAFVKPGHKRPDSSKVLSIFMKEKMSFVQRATKKTRKKLLAVC